MILHPIIVDNQEKLPSPERRAMELQALGASARVAHLEVGDYRWVVETNEGPWWVVTVERKSILDFIASLPPDERLIRFVDETGGVSAPAYHLRVLLIEGRFEDARQYGNRDITAEGFDNLLVSLQMLGIIIIRSESSRQTALRLVEFWKYTGKEEHQTLAQVLRPAMTGVYLNTDKKEAVRGLMSQPGWGEERSKAALAKGKSPGVVIDHIRLRNYTWFKDIKGIGKGLVDTAADFWEREV